MNQSTRAKLPSNAIGDDAERDNEHLLVSVYPTARPELSDELD